VAQQSRLGDATLASRFRSLSALGASLLLRTHQRSRQLHRALQARGYEDELRWLERDLPLPLSQLMLVTAVGAGMLALALLVPS
jgi:cobalt/nickel transport system permease protein